MRLIVACGIMVYFAAPAFASVEDYCKAYAQDKANQVEATSPRWQRRFDSAEKSCVLRFTATAEPTVQAKPKPKPNKSVEVAAPPKPELKPKRQAEVAAKVLPQLEAGSPDWIDYCKKKYVSFDETKGTYTSKTGVVRKCMVTAE